MKDEPTNIRISVFLSKRQKKGLQKLSKRDGAVAAESIRRAIDSYLRKKGITVSDKEMAEDDTQDTEAKS